jgi:serine/threonine protein phosphatase PrpC
MGKVYSSPTPTENTVALPCPAERPHGGRKAAFASVTGINHATNEDCCLHSPSADAPIFCAVADGVGGGAFGEVASHALVSHCAAAPESVYRDAQQLAEWLTEGDAVVREAIARRSSKPGASTLVAAWFLSDERAHVVNIGDCRAYRLSPGRRDGWQIKQLTTDQTYANLGFSHPPNGRPDDPACMAGVGAVAYLNVLPVKLRPKEMLLLCSDGLHKFVNDEALKQLCAEGLQCGRNLQEICQMLVETAQRNGSHDDVSALLVRRHSQRGADWRYWLALLVSLLLYTASVLQHFFR